MLEESEKTNSESNAALILEQAKKAAQHWPVVR